MINPIKINELEESDLPSTFKLKKKQKTEIYNKYISLNKVLLDRGYMPISFPDFIHILLETGLANLNTEHYIKNILKQ